MSTILDFQGGSPTGKDEDPPFKDGQPSEHALGVLYQGPWADEADGFNEHTRRCARALALTGCPVHLRSFGAQFLGGAPKEHPKELAKLLDASISKYSTMIHQMLPRSSSLQNLTTHRFYTMEQMAWINKFRVISTVFEKDRVSDDVVTALNRVGQTWVACSLNAERLSEQGVNNVRVVPVPHFKDDPLLALRGRIRRPVPVRYYHIGKWEPRKSQDQILTAFMRAFKPGQAQLVLKCWVLKKDVEGYPKSPEHHIADLLKSDATIQKNGWSKDNIEKQIEIVSVRLSSESMVALHKFGDVYVTISRGEGFDMPAYDAKLAGNLMVYTPSGGPQDFASDVDILVPASWIKPCHKFYGWEPDACYLDYDLDEVVQAMRVAHNRVLAGVCADKDMSTFAAEKVGRKMLANLEDLVRPVDGKVF